MRRVGAVERTAQGLAIIRSEDDSYPDVGTVLVDESLTELGRVVDVFGPVDRPYLALDPLAADRVATLLGTVTYAR